MKGHLLLVWVLGVVGTTGLYALPSGGPQPADALIVGLFVVIMASVTRDEIEFLRPMVIPLALFVFWVTLRNLVASFDYAELDFAKRTLQVWYTGAVFVTIAIAVRRLIRAGLAYSLACGALAALLVPLVVPMAGRFRGWRAALTFNNPIQFTYYTLLFLSLILLLIAEWRSSNASRKAPRLALILLVVSLAVIHLRLPSAGSVTGIIGLVVGDLVLAGFILSSASIRKPPGVAVALILAVSLATAGYLWGRTAADNITSSRIWGRAEALGLSNLKHRTLGRSGPLTAELFVWGKPTPTTAIGDRLEVHNTALQLVSNYGLPGLSLFVVFLWMTLGPVVHRSPWNLAALLPPLVFQMTQYGLRFRLVWVYLGVIAALHGYRASEGMYKAVMTPESASRERDVAEP